MNKLNTLVFILVATACELQAADQEAVTGGKTDMRLALDLDDGSHVIGSPTIVSIPVQTSFATLNIPLKVIQTISFGAGADAASIMLRNGDKVTGGIHLEPVGMGTVFGDVSIPMEHIRGVRVFSSGGSLPQGDGPLSFGGLNWTPWRTGFEIQGDKLVSLPAARPGFNYGHGGNGRGAELVCNIGNQDWRDYGLELEVGMTGVDPAHNPHGLPRDYRCFSIGFHVADAKESWNEPGTSTYSLNISGDGTWSLACYYNSYCRVPSGFGSPAIEGSRTLAEGKGLKYDPETGHKIRIEVRGTHIQAWVDGGQLVDLHDDKMGETIGGQTLDHGGIAITWGFECMGWIRNFSAHRL